MDRKTCANSQNNKEINQNTDGQTVAIISRCFITGEICPHRKQIIDNRSKRYASASPEVKVFLVMSYSPVTDAIYQWMLKDLFRVSKGGMQLNGFTVDTKNISVERADHYTNTSHVVCESICMKMQEADLVVVDVSFPNPNVFYELGLAISLNKRILPICYKDSYYSRTDESQVFTSIARYPWRDELFRYFSIYTYTNSGNDEQEDELDYYKYDDSIFSKAPYKVGRDNQSTSSETVGENIIKAFNHTLKEDTAPNVLLYNPPVFLSYDYEAFIDHFRQNVVTPIYRAMRQRGDRLLLMYSEKKLRIQDKDRNGHSVDFSFGDICQLAIDQASFEIESNNESSGTENWQRILYNYLYNKTQKIKIDYPIYVDHLLLKRHEELTCLLDGSDFPPSFSYLNVFLAHARHAQTALFDMRENGIVTMFWMGVFHGMGKFTIPIHYEELHPDANQKENKPQKDKEPVEKKRTIADIAGLWQAYYVSETPSKFAATLKEALSTIDEKQMRLKIIQKREFFAITGLDSFKKSGNKDETNILYSFFNQHYRDEFWNTLLAYEDLELILKPGFGNYTQTVSYWDYQSASYIDSFLNRKNTRFKSICSDDNAASEKQNEQANSCEACKRDRQRSRLYLGDRELHSDLFKEGNGCFAEFLKQSYQPFKCDKCDKDNKDKTYCQSCLGETSSMEYRGFRDNADVIKKEFISEHTLISQEYAKVKMPLSLSILGQLAIFREQTTTTEQLYDKCNSHERYHVVLEGLSGPATFGIANLLTDMKNENNDEQSSQNPSKMYLFTGMQRFMLNECLTNLYAILDRLKSAENDQHELIQVVKEYAGYILCDRFLPVISQRFITDIKERITLFLDGLRTSDRVGVESKAMSEALPHKGMIENDLVSIKEALITWYSWLNSICGVTVLIESQVTVKSVDGNRDQRVFKEAILAEGSNGLCFKMLHFPEKSE